MSKSLYFAGPLFSQAELTYNLALTKRLEELGFKVFLPQRDGVEANKPPYDTMAKEERRQATFEMDRDKIIACDVFLFVLDGRVPDEGAAVELGIAYTDRLLSKKSRTLIGLQTDVRAAFTGSKLNPMLRVPLDFIAADEPQLLSYLKQL
jgi:nucleoside 2-deoxyribosyltransferase